MVFCSTCEQYFQIYETKDANGQRCLCFVCHQCKSHVQCTKYVFSIKKYSKQSQMTHDLARFKVDDPTLPQHVSTCPKCLVKTKNRYERKYADNMLFIKNICSNCHNEFV